MKAVIIGHVCIDKNRVEKSTYKSAGSPAVFSSRIFSFLPDVSTTIISYRGSDFDNYAQDLNLQPKNPIPDETLTYNNITQNGKRIQNAFHRESSPPVVIDKKLEKLIKKADILIFAPLLPNFTPDYIDSTIKHACKKCIKILSPQGYFRDFNKNNKVQFRKFKEAKSVIEHFDYVILSNEDYPDLKKQAKKWIKGKETKMIITKAEKGADIISKSINHSFPTIPIDNITDSTGAGDIFTASFAYKYSLTGNEEESINFAHKMAGQSLGYTPENLQFEF